jgi:hypothetical protein
MTKRLSNAWRRQISATMKARFAALPKDESCRKCGEPIVRQYILCRDCWASFSDEQRAAINAAFVPGVTLRNQTDPAYWSAIDEACK